MKVTAETDTGINTKYFTHPEWSSPSDPEGQVFVIRTERELLPYLLMQLEEWCRQIKEVVE